MANLPAEKLEGKQRKLEVGHLSALGVLAEGEPEKALEIAETLGFISNDVRTAVGKNMPGHEVVFEEAVGKRLERRVNTGGEPREAGKVAITETFEDLYGRSWLSQEDVVKKLKKEAPGVLDQINKVLRTEVDPKLGLKGRKPLLAAFNRLFSFDFSSKKIEKILGEKNKEMEPLKTEIGQLSAKKGIWDKAKRVLKVHKRKYKDEEVGSGALGDIIDIRLDKLKKVLDEKDSAEKRAEELEALGKKEVSHGQDFEKMRETLNKLSEIIPEDGKIVFEQYEEEISEYFSKENIPSDLKGWSEWREKLLPIFSDFISFLKILKKAKGDSINKGGKDYATFNTCFNELDSDFKNLKSRATEKALEEYYRGKTELANISKTIKNQETEYQKEADDLLSYISEPFAKLITSDVDENIKTECGKFLTKLKQKFDEAKPEELTIEKIKLFIDSEYYSFINRVSHSVIYRSDKVDGSVNEKNGEFDRLTGDIAYLEKHKTEGIDAGKILGEIFEGIKPADLEKAKRKIKDAESNVAKVTESKEYFSGKKLGDLSVTFTKYEDSLGGNKTVDLIDKNGETEAVSYLNAPLTIAISSLEEEINERRDSRDSKDKDGGYALEEEPRKKITVEINKLKKQLEELKLIQKNAKVLIEELKELSEQALNFWELMPDAVDSILNEIYSGVYVPKTRKDSILINYLVDSKTKLNSLDPDSPTFTCENLSELTEFFMSFSDAVSKDSKFMEKFDEGIPKLEDELKTSKKELSKLEEAEKENLDRTDEQVAKRIFDKLYEEQMPDLSPDDRQIIVEATLVNDVASMRGSEDYEGLAARAKASIMPPLEKIQIKGHITDFAYKEGDKVIQPFEKIESDNFKDWSSIEKLFDSGRINHKTGFFLLAIFENLDSQKGENVKSIETLNIAKKLKALLIINLKAEDKIHEVSEIGKVIDKMFDNWLKEAHHRVDSYSQHFEENRPDLIENKIRELNLRFKRLDEERRLNKIQPSLYKKRRDELLEEAREFGIEKEFGFGEKFKYSQNTLLASFWNSDKSQYLRDGSRGVGSYLWRKAKSVKLGALKLAGKGILGTAKIGIGAGVQISLAPLRAARYPAMYVAKILASPLSLISRVFRGKWWSPFKPGETLEKDLGRIRSFFGAKAKDTVEGTKTALKETIPGEWKKVSYEKRPYKERTEVDTASLKEQAEELGKKAKLEPIEFEETAFSDLDDYKAEIEEIIKQREKESVASPAEPEAKKAI